MYFKNELGVHFDGLGLRHVESSPRRSRRWTLQNVVVPQKVKKSVFIKKGVL